MSASGAMPLQKLLLPLAAAISLLLGGCASMPADRGYGEVRQLVRARGGAELPAPDADARQRVAELLAPPLTAEQAVAVGLLRNPELRAAYARLGLAQSEVLAASRLSNPTLSVSALDANAGGEGTRLSYALVQNFTDALFLSARRRIAARSLDSAKLTIAAGLQDLVADISGAYYQLVGAQQVAQMRRVVATAAGAAAELARRFHAAGNINEREWKREQAAATQALLDAEAADAEVQQARSQLNRLMGLAAGEERWTVAATLPRPVAAEDPPEQLVALALEQRLDLAARQREAQTLDQVQALAQRLRWLPLLAVGIEGERESDGTRRLGPTISLELPLFNQGQGSLARVNALREQIQAEVAALEGDISNAVMAAHRRVSAARARAERHLTELIPQREAVVARTQELQNYMIVGQFELLLAKQDEYDAYQGYLEALRDYWRARVDLARAVGTSLPSDARRGAGAVGAVVLPDAPPPAGHDGPDSQPEHRPPATPVPPHRHDRHGGH